MADPRTSSAIPRPLALLLLVVCGLLSLPAVAALLDGESTDELIVPVQIAVMTVLGAVVGYLAPALGGAGSSRMRSVGVGVVVAVVAALVGGVVLFVLLGGL